MQVKITKVQAIALLLFAMGYDTATVPYIEEEHLGLVPATIRQDTLIAHGCKIRCVRKGASVSFFLVGYCSVGNDINRALADIALSRVVLNEGGMHRLIRNGVLTCTREEHIRRTTKWRDRMAPTLPHTIVSRSCV